jgi:hypothetical protein
MATLFQATNGEWTPRELPRDRILDAAEFGQAGWQINPLGGTPGYSLMVWPHVAARVNGEHVGTIVVLEHRDEVRIDGQCWCFSRESRPQLSVFHAMPGRRAPKCALCSNEFADGDDIVVCPGCCQRFHQMDATANRKEKRCFTYEPITKCCHHPTDLDGANLWQPESDIVPEVHHET